MIKREEIVKSDEQLTPELEKNLEVLLEKLNKVRDAYAIPLHVTSGYRSIEKHKAIYAEKNAKRKDEGLEPLKIPMGSAHLSCEAVDFSDPSGKLKDWVLHNVKLFEDLDLYMEDFSATPNWLHVQTRKSKSGNRFFKP